MNSAEADIQISVIKLNNLTGIAFPLDGDNITPINTFAQDESESDLTTQRLEIPYSIDLKQIPTDLETRINQINILTIAGIRQSNSEFDRPSLDTINLFRTHLKDSLLPEKNPQKENIQAIDILKAYGNFITVLKMDPKFTCFYPKLTKPEPLNEYLLSMGVKLIGDDGPPVYREVVNQIPEIDLEAVTVVTLDEKPQDNLLKPQALRERLSNFLTWVLRKNKRTQAD